MKYIIKETFITKRNTALFSFVEQAKDEERQAKEYINDKLGDKYKSIEVSPPKRKKIECPTDCGNTYVWIKRIYATEDNKKQILFVECANVLCGEYFYVYLETAHE